MNYGKWFEVYFMSAFGGAIIVACILRCCGWL